MLAPRSLFSEINRILSALRASLDVGSYSTSVSQSHSREVTEVYLAFEALRLEYRAETHGMIRGDGALYNAQPIIRLIAGLTKFIDDPTNRQFASLTRFRPLNMARSSSEFAIHPAFNSGRLTASEAIDFLIEGSRRFSFQHELFPQEDDGLKRRIREVVPQSQKIAPVHFEIRDDRLAIRSQVPKIGGEDSANVAAATGQLLRQGEEIIENLSRSNCDRRLIETVRGLQSHLESGNDIVALGLKNIACNLIAEKFEPELPEALVGMLVAQTTGIGMLVAQYPEWQRFTENAATTQISQTDSPRVREAITAVIEKIEIQPNVTEPEVPKTLRALRAFLDDPAIESRRAIFAIWRTLENLSIVAFNFAADFIGDTAKKTSKKASSATSTAIAIAIVSAAFAGAATLAPSASQIPESAWLAKAVDLIRPQIPQ